MENDNARTLSEAEILRLHQEQDPASPLYKGPQPTGTGVSGATAEGAQPASAYYEPTGDKVDPIADRIPEPQGTTPFTTEEVTKPYEVPEPENQVAPQAGATPEQTAILQAGSEPAPEGPSVTPTEDAGSTGA